MTTGYVYLVSMGNVEDQDDPNALCWSTTPPTEPGWYWTVYMQELHIVQVVQDEFQDVKSFVAYWLDYTKDLQDFSAWLGPLPVPDKYIN